MNKLKRMDSIKVITRGNGLRLTFFRRHSIYPSRPQTAQAQRVKIHPEKAFSELIIPVNCKPGVLEAFNCRYFFNLPGQHLLVKFAQEQLVILSQTFKSLRESVYQNLLQTRFKPLLDQVTLKLDSNDIRLDFSALEAALRTNPVTPELQQVLDTLNVRVPPSAALCQESYGQDVLLEYELAETLYGDGDNANNFKDADDYRPGIRFAAPIDNPFQAVSRLKHQRALKSGKCHSWCLKCCV